MDVISSMKALILTGMSGTALISCSLSIEPGFGERCVESIANSALENPNSPTIASNVAAQIGFAPGIDPNSPDLETKQVEFGTPDGSMHYFAIQGAAWTRAALISLTPAPDTSPPLLTFYVIDRKGNLFQAAQATGPDIAQLDIRDERVTEGFARERELWRITGADEACGRG